MAYHSPFLTNFMEEWIMWGILTALLQTALSILPVMLLYLPFKEGGAMNHPY